MWLDNKMPKCNECHKRRTVVPGTHECVYCSVEGLKGRRACRACSLEEFVCEVCMSALRGLQVLDWTKMQYAVFD
jgi:hypothetical protein